MKPKFYILLVLVCVALVTGFLFLADPDPAEDERRAPDQFSAVDQIPQAPASPPERRGTSRHEDDSPVDSPQGAPAPDETSAFEADRSSRDDGTRSDEPPSAGVETSAAPQDEVVAGTEPDPSDAGLGEDMRPWNDPVNRRVLGDKRWMAPVDPDESKRIDETFERARAARFDPGLSRKGKLAAIAAAERIVDACFEQLARRQPGIEGRLIVRWTTGAEGGVGWIADPSITNNYRLEDPSFEACILDGLSRARFSAADGDAVEIEYPFFYDGAF